MTTFDNTPGLADLHEAVAVRIEDIDLYQPARISRDAPGAIAGDATAQGDYLVQMPSAYKAPLPGGKPCFADQRAVGQLFRIRTQAGFKGLPAAQILDMEVSAGILAECVCPFCPIVYFFSFCSQKGVAFFQTRCLGGAARHDLCQRGGDFERQQADVALLFDHFSGGGRACDIDGAYRLAAGGCFYGYRYFSGFEVEYDFVAGIRPVADGYAVYRNDFIARYETCPCGDAGLLYRADIGAQFGYAQREAQAVSNTARIRLVRGPAATMAMRLAGCCLSKA